MSCIWHSAVRQYQHEEKARHNTGNGPVLNPLFFALVAVILAGQRPNSSTAANSEATLIDIDDADFDRYQRGLVSLNRRLDAVEATLGGLAALEIAAMIYMLEKVAGDRLWSAGILGLMSAALALALVGIFAFGGDETPNLVEFHEERGRDRKRAIRGAIGSMTETYEFNERQVSRKVSLRLISVWLTALVGAFFAFRVVELIK